VSLLVPVVITAKAQLISIRIMNDEISQAIDSVSRLTRLLQARSFNLAEIFVDLVANDGTASVPHNRMISSGVVPKAIGEGDAQLASHEQGVSRVARFLRAGRNAVFRMGAVAQKQGFE